MREGATLQRPAMQVLVAALAVTAAVIAVTWPQAQYLTTHVYPHVDPFFSMWRVDWIAHVLPNSPSSLFDANIFYPVRRTLAMSDATLLQGVIGAPLLWAGVSPVTVYNLLLLGGMVGSGIGMFVLARRLTGAAGPATLAAVIFATAPYRLEHVMHLELQWAMWIPLTLWSIHRALDEDSWRFGLFAGVLCWLQIISSVYYGVFLAITVAFTVLLLVVVTGLGARTRGLAGLAAGAVVAIILTVPYALPYRANAEALGDRSITEVGRYSAQLRNYAASPPTNHWWGWTSQWGGAELSLFPGLLALVLAAVGLANRPRRMPLIYLTITLFAVELSLGTNGWLYSGLLGSLGSLQGLRAPSRFGIVSLCAISVLAAFGVRYIQQRARPVVASSIVAGALIFAVLEYRTMIPLDAVAPQPDEQVNVYAAIRRLGPGVVLEWPLPRLDRLPGYDAMYAFWSREHWNPLVNGYSGYYPEEFAELIVNTYDFPGGDTIDFLRERDVRYVTVHEVHLYGQDLDGLLEAMRADANLEYIGRFEAPSGHVQLFRLRPIV